MRMALEAVGPGREHFLGLPLAGPVIVSPTQYSKVQLRSEFDLARRVPLASCHTERV